MKKIIFQPTYTRLAAPALAAPAAAPAIPSPSNAPHLKDTMRLTILLFILLLNGALLFLWITMDSTNSPSRVLWYTLAVAVGILSGVVLLYGGSLQGRGTQLVNTFIFVSPFLNVTLYETFMANVQNARGTAAHKRQISRIVGIVLVSITLVSVLVVLTATRSSSRSSKGVADSVENVRQMIEMGAENIQELGILV